MLDGQERGAVAMTSGEVDIEGLMERIRERVSARQAASLSNSTAAAPAAQTATDQDGLAPAKEDASAAIARTLLLFAGQLEGCQRSLAAAEQWLQAETEDAARRDQETRMQIEQLSRSVARLEDELASLARRTDQFMHDVCTELRQLRPAEATGVTASAYPAGWDLRRDVRPGFQQNGHQVDAAYLARQLQLLIDLLTPIPHGLENGTGGRADGVLRLGR